MHSHIAAYRTISQLNWGSMTRKAFEGYDEPVNIGMEPEEALKILLVVEKTDEADDED